MGVEKTIVIEYYLYIGLIFDDYRYWDDCTLNCSIVEMSKFSQGSKRKNKSEIIKKLSIHQKPELQDVNAEIIVNWTLKYLIEQMNDVIDEAEQKIYIDRMLIPASMSLKYMDEMLCPEEH